MKWYFFESSGRLVRNFQVVDKKGYVFVCSKGVCNHWGKRLGPGTVYKPLETDKVIDFRK